MSTYLSKIKCLLRGHYWGPWVFARDVMPPEEITDMGYEARRDRTCLRCGVDQIGYHP